MAPDAGATGPADVTSDAPPPPKGTGFTNSRTPAFVAFGVAGAGLVIGTAFGIAALSAKSTYDDTPTYKKAEAVENASVISDVGFATFLIAGLTGAIFYLHNGPVSAGSPPSAGPAAKRTTPNPTLTGFRIEPTVTSKTQGASLTLRF